MSAPARPRRKTAGRGVAQRLFHLDIELTERCDNDCVHCCINLPAHDPRAAKKELDTGEWKGILGQAAALGALSVRFTGGEPLLREDFAELYLHARRLGMKVVIFTNARRITPELAGLLARVPPLERVEVSAYGMSRKAYEAVSRTPGSFAQFRRGLDRLLRHGVPFIVKGVLLPANREEADEFESWAMSLPWVDRPPAVALLLELRGRRDSARRNRLIERLRLPPEEVVRFLNRRRREYRREMKAFCRRFIAPPGRRLFACGAGQGGCVDAYGRLQPCLSLRAPGLSNDLRRVSLKRALASGSSMCRSIVARDPAYIERCARCFLKGLCEQCPARSWSESGTLDAPVAYLCRVAHAQARDLGLLAAGETGWEVRDWRGRIAAMS